MKAIVSTAVFTGAFVVGAFLVLVVVNVALKAVPVERPTIGLDLMPEVRKWRSSMEADRDHVRVAFFGDSKLWGPPGEALPDRTQQILSARHATKRLKLHLMTWPALDVSGHYCIADQVVAAAPDLIVIELNMKLLGPEPPGPGAVPQMAGWIEGARLLEAAFLPLSYADITLNRLLFYRFLVVSRMDDEWGKLLRIQATLVKAREPLESRIESILGTGESYGLRKYVDAVAVLNRAVVPGTARETRAHALRSEGDVLRGMLPSYSRFVVLRAVLDRYHRAGIKTMVWATPVNVRHLRSLGLSLDGLDRTIGVIRDIVEEEGATFVDLHAVVPDAAFTDTGDHYTTNGPKSAASLLARKLAPQIAKISRIEKSDSADR